jgi:hypothetical protein
VRVKFGVLLLTPDVNKYLMSGDTQRTYTVLVVNRHHHVYTRFSPTIWSFVSFALWYCRYSHVRRAKCYLGLKSPCSRLRPHCRACRGSRSFCPQASGTSSRSSRSLAYHVFAAAVLARGRLDLSVLSAGRVIGYTEGLTVAWELFFSTIRVLVTLTMGKSEVVATIETIGTCDLQMVERRKVFPTKPYAISNRFLRVVTRVCLALADTLTPYRMLQTFNKTSYLVFKIDGDTIPESTNSNRRHLIGRSV